MKVIK
ncbi:unnamed protein product, partial [Allacma fusca]|jgi:hypothetical protein